MGNYNMRIDLFNNKVQCSTEGFMVSLNDLERAGNAWRLSNGYAYYQLAAFLSSKTLEEYIKAAAKVWDLPEDTFLRKAGKGKTSRTMAHISVAMLFAEQMSPEFHAMVHKTFIDGRILEFRGYGGTEFTNLNMLIDSELPERRGKDNKGVFIQTAIALRNKILGKDAKAGDWDSATVEQTHLRYEHEAYLCRSLRMGLIRDYEHLKEIIEKL